MLPEYAALLEAHTKAEPMDKWNVPFPMGVFGTLRKGWGNHPLMGLPPGQEKLEEDSRAWRRRNKEFHYKSHHKAFLPHFTAVGLSIQCKPDASAVFEIYTYEPEDWTKMIPDVDSLESFRPGREKHEYGYYRTLVYLRLLPDDFKTKKYDEEYDRYSYDNRDGRSYGIPHDEWKLYPKVPAWVYSSKSQNKLCNKLDDSPIIWEG